MLSDMVYVENLMRSYRRMAEDFSDRIPHMYDPRRLVKRWKRRMFVIRKFSCGRPECGICGKRQQTQRWAIDSRFTQWQSGRAILAPTPLTWKS